MEVGEPHQTYEFRSRPDDSWRPVKLDINEDSLFVSFVELTVAREREVYRTTAFLNLVELESFRARFRPLSMPLADTDCHKVHAGMKVCVTHDVTPDDWRFYDGLVNQVKRVEHNLVDKDDEECLCDFHIFLMHGPLVGKGSWKRLQKIQLIVSETKMHPVLADFFAKARERIKVLGKLISNLPQARQRSDDIGSSKGPEPLAFYKSFPKLENDIGLCMPAIGARHQQMIPSDFPTLWPPSHGMPDIPEMNMEYRSMKDDAWHWVTPRLMLNGRLNLVYEDYTTFGMQETYEPDKFNTLGEIEDFRERFRPLTGNLTPNECGEVKVGAVVCVRMNAMETVEGKLYDSVVKEVVRYEHAVLEFQEEICFCSFQIFWKHGPLGGTISTANLDRICLISSSTFEIHSAITSFLDSARLEVTRPKKRSRMGNQDPGIPPGFYAGNNHYGKMLSRGQPSKRNKGKEIVEE